MKFILSENAVDEASGEICNDDDDNSDEEMFSNNFSWTFDFGLRDEVIQYTEHGKSSDSTYNNSGQKIGDQENRNSKG